MIHLKEVIHFYFKIWGTVTESQSKKYENGNWALDSGILKRFLLDELKFKPHLLRIESMTLDEWNVLKMQLSPELGFAVRGVYSHVHILKTRLSNNTLTFRDGLVLIKASYDIFDLIETNQAIDAKCL